VIKDLNRSRSNAACAFVTFCSKALAAPADLATTFIENPHSANCGLASSIVTRMMHSKLAALARRNGRRPRRPERNPSSRTPSERLVHICSSVRASSSRCKGARREPSRYFWEPSISDPLHLHTGVLCANTPFIGFAIGLLHRRPKSADAFSGNFMCSGPDDFGALLFREKG
jgi:hypothetical protein